MNKKSSESMSINLEIRHKNWINLVRDPKELCLSAARAALKSVGVSGQNIEIGVILADNKFVQILNQKWLGKDYPTNVLAFPNQERHDDSSRLNLLGDIVIAFGVVKQEAKDQKKTISDHVAHMIVHGTLHLLGYDHISEKSAVEMELLEINALSGINIADPYFSN